MTICLHANEQYERTMNVNGKVVQSPLEHVWRAFAMPLVPLLMMINSVSAAAMSAAGITPDSTALVISGVRREPSTVGSG